MPLDALTPLVSTACADFLGRGVPAEDLTQEAWVYALEAAASYDPAAHRCTREAYIVRRVKCRLDRYCARERAHRLQPLPAAVEASPLRQTPPPLSAILNERIEAERKRIDGGKS